MPTATQDKDFGSKFLDEIVDWIKDNLGPGDVFDDQNLRDYVAETALPGDVFPDTKLDEWAESNGYKKEEE